MRHAPAHRAHLDLLGTTSQAASFAASVLRTLALGGGVLPYSGRGDYMHMGGTRMHLRRVIGIRDVMVGWSCRARGRW